MASDGEGGGRAHRGDLHDVDPDLEADTVEAEPELGWPGKRTLLSRSDRDTSAGRPGVRTLVERAMHSPGSPLPRRLQRRLERSLGADLAAVRVHTSPESNRAAEELGADAFTVGADIHFAPGRFDLGSVSGERLLAHEVAHTVQPRAASTGVEVTAPGGPEERDAEGFAASFGAAASPHRASPAGRTATPEAAGAGAMRIARSPATNASPASPGSTASPPELVAVRAAITRRDPVRLRTEFLRLSQAARQRWHGAATLVDDVLAMIDILGREVLGYVLALGIDFTRDRRLAERVLDRLDVHWWPKLKASGLWDSVLRGLPQRHDLSNAQARKLGEVLAWTGDDQRARAIFEIAYPPLLDRSQHPDRYRTLPWRLAWIKKLYEVLAQYLPVDQTSEVDGFLIAHQEFTDGSWKKMGRGGFFWGRFVYLNDPNYRQGASGRAEEPDDPGRGMGTVFESSALHEVGHSVGAISGGDFWAMQYGDWQEHGIEDWSSALWVNGLPLADLADGRVPLRALSESEARLYMAGVLQHGSRPTPPGFRNDDELVESLWRFKDQPLFNYWWRFRDNREQAYAVDHHNVAGSRVYACTVQSHAPFISYERKLLDSKLSSYSLASYKEWFAENYAHYFRSRGHGVAMPAEVKRRFDSLAADHHNGPGGGVGEIYGAPPATPGQMQRRTPFPW